MSVIILLDEIVHYEVLGRGRPVVFLHGWVGSWRYWIPTMQSASIGYRTYALDLWGFGDSAKNPARYPLDQQISLLDQFLARLGIGKTALIGHGLGAVVAMLFAALNAENVDRVMAIAAPLGENSLNPRLTDSPPAELVDWLVNRAPNGDAARGEAPKTDRSAIQATLAQLAQIKTLDLAQRLRTPCLWVRGQNDPMVNEPTTDPLAVLPDQAHYLVFDASGHFPMLDEPTKFNRLVADFLALASGESPRQLQLKEEWRRRIR